MSAPRHAAPTGMSYPGAPDRGAATDADPLPGYVDPMATDVLEEIGGHREVTGGPDVAARSRRLLIAVLVAVNLPVLVATVRALAAGWQPLGDNGILLVRARDVGTSHHPLLGSWTSASLVLDQDVNNPGPLYFDAIAPTVKLLGPWVGAAVGVMLLNMAASSLAVVAARRISGAESMVAVAVAIAGLQFAMGSELLFDMWQPNALVLPFLAFLVVATVLATGDLAMAPWVVGLGSVIVQTHMSHAALVVALTFAGAVLCILSVRRGPAPPSWRRPLMWTVAVAVLAWVQPLVEQFTGRGEGNLSRIAGAATAGDAAAIGWSRATRLTVEIAAMGPWFTRTSYASAVPPTAPDAPVSGIVGIGLATAVLAAILVGLAIAAVWAARRGRGGTSTMITMAGVALTAAYVALATSPVNYIALAIHQMRWLWPIAAFLTAAGLTTAFTALRSLPRVHRGALIAGAAAAAVVAVANLPTHTSDAPGPTDTAEYLETGQDLMSQLGKLEDRGTVLYDASTLIFAEPFSGLTFAELQDRGIPFVFTDEGFVRQFGEGRRDDGTADLRLWQVEGSGALVVPPGAERVALADGGPLGPVALFVEPIDR